MTHRGKTPFTSPGPCPIWQASRSITLPQPVNRPLVLSFVHADKKGPERAVGGHPALGDMSWSQQLLYWRGSVVSLGPLDQLILHFLQSFLCISFHCLLIFDLKPLLSICCLHYRAATCKTSVFMHAIRLNCICYVSTHFHSWTSVQDVFLLYDQD